MIGSETEPPPSPPIILSPPQPPGQVAHDILHPLDFRGDDIVTRNLLREELGYFANDALSETFSKMRVLLQEDIQDALRQVEVRVSCAAGSKHTPGAMNAQHVFRKAQWAEPRPAFVTAGALCNPEVDDVRPPPLQSKRAPSETETDLRPPVPKIKETFCDIETELSPPSLTKKGRLSDGVGSEDLTSRASRMINSKALRKFVTQTSMLTIATQTSLHTRNSQGTEISAVEMERNVKKMKSIYRNKNRRHAKKFVTSNALEQESMFKITLYRLCEMFFEHGIMMIIILNGIFIGVQTDYQARNLTEAVPEIFRVVEIIFCMIFSVELSVSICLLGKRYFVGPGWRWNWFDAILVVIQLIEVGGMLFTNHESSSASPVANVTFLRLLRLFRVLRLIRLVEFIGELKTIISSIANSLRSLCWTLFLLLLMIYIVGILFTQVVFSQVISKDNFDPSIDELSKWWGTLDRSILSLYQAILGGVDWEDLTLPISNHVSPLLTLLFCWYIAFTLLAMMNVITGIFVESALQNAEKEKDADFSETAHALFLLSDVDQSGRITWEEFEMQIDEPSFRWCMKNFGIDPVDAKLLFQLLDRDKSGSLDLEELLSGMIRLRAGATFMDVMKIMHKIDKSNRKMDVRVEPQEKAHALS